MHIQKIDNTGFYGSCNIEPGCPQKIQKRLMDAAQKFDVNIDINKINGLPFTPLVYLISVAKTFITKGSDGKSKHCVKQVDKLLNQCTLPNIEINAVEGIQPSTNCYFVPILATSVSGDNRYVLNKTDRFLKICPQQSDKNISVVPDADIPERLYNLTKEAINEISVFFKEKNGETPKDFKLD